MTLDRDNYAKPTGVVRMMEKKLLPQSAVERILDAPLEDAMKLLAQNSSVDFSEWDGKNPSGFEAILQQDLAKTYEFIYSICPDPIVIDIVRLKYKYHNKKALAKSLVTGEDAAEIYIFPEETVTGSIDTDITDPQKIDFIYDEQYYRELVQLADLTGNEFIIDYCRMSVDFYNVKVFLRARAMKKPFAQIAGCLIEGGKVPVSKYFDLYDKSLDAVENSLYYQFFGSLIQKGIESFESTGHLGITEKLLDDALMAEVKKSKLVSFGPEVLFAYMLAKENEVRQIRLIMTCKQNDIDSAVIRERLRDNYA